MIAFRADANSEIGSGHIMRCLSIAKALQKLEQDIVFITADDNGKELIRREHFPSISLNTQWTNMEGELLELEKAIIKYKIQVLIVDSYYVTHNYMKRAKDLVKIVYLDDLNQFVYPTDILINYNIYVYDIQYSSYYSENTTLLLGCDYVPLREEFSGRIRTINPSVNNILITTGGSDSYNMAGQLLSYIRKFSKFDSLNLHIIVGALNKNVENLNKLSKLYPNIILHRAINNMADIMMECDIAISAGGSTLYELCACGLPTISYSFADNQLWIVNKFNQEQIIYYSGDIRGDISACLGKVNDSLSTLMKDALLRKELSLNMQNLTDGRGSYRIAEKVLKLL
ncbi:UDP-2,4-diacetamido-2,4,6-trideoxy-beta-L-altropyranose hydrolase [Lachnospiraceae bacterium MD1]|uniref:UDP-2,4-diacetamido-2,4, 6-trideoxy-beta-L-altropyranose hydrolase n=1 Tax=Variimorphobacter saccharofermentans TaxID=2755051 RepID=A0A839K487_9FIRM|nr:UDP-2,4-diacetamido-2,4,6-trideoxy-beta-L-altropyranose hydrolase [Variimorphobacter saccharofermentans]MBB2184188.1 UDP-2,4-diacetamido-2,4,6-trideoxy-beta-L-altropyranose hydrolase [Variimorphobacter saccharofermentans]